MCEMPLLPLQPTCPALKCAHTPSAPPLRQGPEYAARLVGVRDMPRGSSRLSLDFSSLLGPLFML